MKTRREFLLASAAAAVSHPIFGQAPAFVRSGRPETTAIMAGDVYGDSAVIWARAGKPSRLHVTWKTAEGAEPHRILGPHCLEDSDGTGRVELIGLPPGQTILYDVQLQDLTNERTMSEPVRGTFRTPALTRRDVRFVWTGDQVGQGWGINPEFGGMKIYQAMGKLSPDFFLHSGDTIYADGPLQAEVKLPDGTMWRNLVTEQKSKVAETLDEFRGNYRYNLMDANMREFISGVAQVWQWDDHEAMNNWSPSKSVADNPQYKEKNVPLMVARATRAFREYAPIRANVTEPERIYRKISYGPLLDMFVVDMRTYRGPNTTNRQSAEGPETQYLGREQFNWLAKGLRESKAMWKAIAADMPIGLYVPDGKNSAGEPLWEASANGDAGPASGRELEIARLLQFIKTSKVQNVVWFTADVHYTAAHYYDPAPAKLGGFDPFWEFVSGPMNAGAFGPNPADGTFGLQVKFQKAPPAGQMNLGPASGMQFFGDVLIDGKTAQMTVTLRDLTGGSLYTQVLAPVLSRKK